MAVPEIHQGDFVYRDTFFAEVGENKRHPRASVAELKDLLLPKKGSAPPKDNVGHWYEAQLLHYGIPRSKEKNTAKIRLLQAVTQGSLSVPQHLVQMEATMKKDYAAAGRKLKAEAKKAEQKPVEEKAVPKGKKRKQDDVDSNGAKAASTKISVTVGEVPFNIEHQSGSVSEPSAKKQKKTPATDTVAKPASKPGPKAKESPAPAEKSKKTKAAPTADAPKITETATRKKQTARKSTGSTIPPPSKPPPSAKKSTRAATKSVKAKTIEALTSIEMGSRSQPIFLQSSTNVDIDMTDAPPLYEAHSFTPAPSPRAEPKSRATQISGSYAIPWTNVTHTLYIRIDHARDQLWGRIRMPFTEFVLMATDINSIARGQSTSFGWRMHNTGDGSIRFGRGCNGQIEFDGRGGVQVVAFGFCESLPSDMVWEGHMVGDDAPEAAEFEDEWDDFVERAYGRRDEREESYPS